MKSENKIFFLLRNCIFTVVFFVSAIPISYAQHSVAREWNEVLLEGIRNDFARPTVHARNLFHFSTLMYDSWAVFDTTATTYFLGKETDGFISKFEAIDSPVDKQKAVETVMSYACYRLFCYRFKESPGADYTLKLADSLMTILGYSKDITNETYQNGDYAALGNYMANQMIEFGHIDGSNELNDYSNKFYKPLNPGLDPERDTDPQLKYPNNWQPLEFDVFVDQSDNVISGNTPEFLGPEWGGVTPFSLTDEDLVFKERRGHIYPVYLDPGMPDLLGDEGIEDDYKWGFLLTAMWSSHLHPSDGVMLDISPKSLGNITQPLTDFLDMRSYYKDSVGGDISTGHNVNPYTGQPYQEQLVPRGDYARVLAEFWADGPDSETPPGHWFTILNTINDNPLSVKKYKGQGEVLANLEWDVKSYFLLGGAMHDCAIAAWGAKGYYDYIRPISAIRHMATKGQSSDSGLPSYSPQGIPLVNGFCELVTDQDALAGTGNADVGKIKLYAWKGPRYISNSQTDDAGVGWILAENWWPYQRPSFVTPPFAGYVSGHSTFSRAAADVLTELTGSAFFPGGMGEFIAKKDEFLVFEDGPSVDIVLQWATYRDASDQTSLSRIWGGIHPPMDDIVGRIMGEKIAIKVLEKSQNYFDGIVAEPRSFLAKESLFPNPVFNEGTINIRMNDVGKVDKVSFYTLKGQFVIDPTFIQIANEIYVDIPSLTAGHYYVSVIQDGIQKNFRVMKQ